MLELKSCDFAFFLRNATPKVQITIVVIITINAISGNISDPGTPDVNGKEAKTAAANPRGSIIVISDLES